MNRHIERTLGGLLGLICLTVVCGFIPLLAYGIYKAPYIIGPMLILAVAYWMGYDVEKSAKRHKEVEERKKEQEKILSDIYNVKLKETKDGSQN